MATTEKLDAVAKEYIATVQRTIGGYTKIANELERKVAQGEYSGAVECAEMVARERQYREAIDRLRFDIKNFPQ